MCTSCANSKPNSFGDRVFGSDKPFVDQPEIVRIGFSEQVVDDAADSHKPQFPGLRFARRCTTVVAPLSIRPQMVVGGVQQVSSVGEMPPTNGRDVFGRCVQQDVHENVRCLFANGGRRLEVLEGCRHVKVASQPKTYMQVV